MTLEEISYIYGLFITDGSISQRHENSYITRLELEYNDIDIIKKLCNIIPNSSYSDRIRDTNFKENYHSVILINYSQDFPLKLFEMGFPCTDKTNIACPPKITYNEPAFWRGVIDGDGSLGIRKQSRNRGMEPYLSLTTKSEFLKEAYCKYLYQITSKEYNPHRNQRDNIYNITCAGASAKRVLDNIYNNANIYLDRKYNKYQEINQFIINNNIIYEPLYILKQFDKETNELCAVYGTCGEAQKITGFTHIADASVKNSRYKTLKGFIWKRIYEGEEGYDRALVGYRR